MNRISDNRLAARVACLLFILLTLVFVKLAAAQERLVDIDYCIGGIWLNTGLPCEPSETAQQPIFADDFEGGSSVAWDAIENEIEADFCVMLEWVGSQQNMQVQFRVVGESAILGAQVACPGGCHGLFESCFTGSGLSRARFNRELLPAGSSLEWLTLREGI